LEYIGGQADIVHLEADLRGVVDWANGENRRWAFSTGNAATAGVGFHTDLCQLGLIDWDAIQAHSWSNVSAAKQAEFLLHEFFPWHLIYRIGVSSNKIRHRVDDLVRETTRKPRVTVEPNWYYS
jgi:hypothetical protein